VDNPLPLLPDVDLTKREKEVRFWEVAECDHQLRFSVTTGSRSSDSDVSARASDEYSVKNS
jgi:hypothetical protein